MLPPAAPPLLLLAAAAAAGAAGAASGTDSNTSSTTPAVRRALAVADAIARDSMMMLVASNARRCARARHASTLVRVFRCVCDACVVVRLLSRCRVDANGHPSRRRPRARAHSAASVHADLPRARVLRARASVPTP